MTAPAVVAPLRPAFRFLMLGFIGVVSLCAMAMVLPGFAARYGVTLNVGAYPIAALGAGIALIASGSRHHGREAWAWAIMGAGVACWGIGETVWQAYTVRGLEVPYPGVADLFYVLGYPLMGVGVLLLPHVRPGRFERFRLALDAVVGTIAISIVMWVTYLGRIIVFDREASLLTNTVNAFYPAGDVVLLVAVMVLTLRRSEYRFDARLVTVAAGLVAVAIADIVYYAQVEAGTYAEGSWLDALWLGSYAAFGTTAYLASRSRTPIDAAMAETRWWHLAAPYGAVMVLFVLSLANVEGGDALLNWTTAVVGGLIIVRQGVAIRENRELIEKQRDDLVSSVSHELRTPLTSVQGYAQFLASDWEYLSDTDRQAALSAVDVQSRHLGQLVTDLVDAARNRLGAAVLDRAEVSLPGIVQQAIATLPEAHRGQVSMEAPPQLMVDADPHRLLQILLNLLTNAARYGNGRILVVVERAETAARIMVHDNGPGVPKKFESVIWERFERGAHRFDSLIPGSGIGLPIARALVEAHGGTIGQHRSAILGGACFSFTMPLADAVAGPARGGLRLGDMSVVTVSPPLRAGAVAVAAHLQRAEAEAAA